MRSLRWRFLKPKKTVSPKSAMEPFQRPLPAIVIKLVNFGTGYGLEIFGYAVDLGLKHLDTERSWNSLWCKTAERKVVAVVKSSKILGQPGLGAYLRIV